MTLIHPTTIRITIPYVSVDLYIRRARRHKWNLFTIPYRKNELRLRGTHANA